jgi:hypothetical protein
MTWQENLEKQTERKNMKAFISGWIMIFLAVACVVAYIFLPAYWKDINPNIFIGWWLFAAGFFIAGVYFLSVIFESENK